MIFRIAVLFCERPGMHRAEFFNVQADGIASAQLELFAYLKERRARQFKGIINPVGQS